MAERMKGAVYHGIGDIRVEDLEVPRCGAQDIVVRVRACAICGTDVHTYRKGSIFASPGQVLGHELAGVVTEVGADVVGIGVGDHVTAWPIVHCDDCPSCSDGNWHLCVNALGASVSSGVPGGFAEYVRIPRARPGRTVYRLPEGLDWRAAALVEPLSVALRAASFARIGPTETAVVTGLGGIGLLVAQTLKLQGAGRVIGVEPSGRRRQAALASGVDDVLDAGGDDLGDRLEQLGLGDRGRSGPIAAYECSGTPEALRSIADVVKPGGTVVLVGLFGKRVEVDIDKILLKEITVRGTYAYRDEFPEAISLLASNSIDVSSLVSHVYELDDIAAAFETQCDPSASVKVMIENPALTL